MSTSLCQLNNPADPADLLSLQFYNSAALVNRGMGTVLRFEDMTKETIQSAIEFALKKTTQENAKKVSYSFRNRAQRPVETAIWWVEHVAATGGNPFAKPYSPFMNWYEYHLIDVYGCVAGVVIIFIFICALIIKMISRILCAKKSTKIE